MLILWSGGCDSTWMLYWYARQAVATGAAAPRSLAIDYNQQIPGTKQQQKSRQRILKELRRRKLPVDHAELTLTNSSNHIWLETGVGGSGLVQPGLWISLAQTFLQPEEDLYLGYIRGDDIWHSKGDLLALFENGQRILKKTGKLELPLEWHRKNEVIADLRREGLLDLCWYCEKRGTVRPCGECGSCSTMRAGLYLEGSNQEKSKRTPRKPKRRKR